MRKRPSREKVAEQVAALNAKTLSELRIIWSQHYGDPPKHRAPQLLRRILAWRIQADAFGGLDEVTIRLLKNTKSTLMVAEQPGTRLAREYGGKRHEVIIVDGGVMYEGTCYNSLSAIARVITGQRWNGPRFFGLRQENVR